MKATDLSHALVWAGLVLVALQVGQGLTLGKNYIGIGYNLLKANPNGENIAGGGVDPGLLITRRILDLSGNPQAIATQMRHTCSNKKTVSTFYGAKSYQNKLAVGVKLGGEDAADLVKAMFSLSRRFQRQSNETNTQHQVFQDEQAICNLGRVRLQNGLLDWLNVSVTNGFASSACGLPAQYSQKEYMDFLDNWGTHMTTEVDIGTKVIHRSRSSLAEYVKHVVMASGADVSMEGSYMGYGSSLRVNINSFRSRDSYSQSFGSRCDVLHIGTQDMPEPISVTLVGIDEALKAIYWDSQLSTYVSRGYCDANWRTEVIATNLRRALAEYATYKMVQEIVDPPLRVPLTWPRGTYGLSKAMTGCPGGRLTWNEGWRFQDTGPSNRMSSSLHLAGSWPQNGNIRMDFCIKGTPSLSEYDVEWPAGDYCIYKYGNCPTGFQQGFVQWDDVGVSSVNTAGGTLPDGVYDKNTKIMFCCRNDEVPTKSIYLPVEKPFYLLRHTRGCQSVHQMQTREEIVQWDEAFDFFFFGYSSDERLGGSHPFDDGNENHCLHFCYYYPRGDAGHSGSAGSVIG